MQVERPTPRPTRRSLAPGRLFIRSNPWGTLYIDDVEIGNTPKVNLTIAAGTHIIRVERFGFEPYVRRIEVAPGQEIRLTDVILRAIPR